MVSYRAGCPVVKRAVRTEVAGVVAKIPSYQCRRASDRAVVVLVVKNLDGLFVLVLWVPKARYALLLLIPAEHHHRNPVQVFEDIYLVEGGRKVNSVLSFCFGFLAGRNIALVTAHLKHR